MPYPFKHRLDKYWRDIGVILSAHNAMISANKLSYMDIMYGTAKMQQDAVKHGRLRSRCRHLANVTKQAYSSPCFWHASCVMHKTASTWRMSEKDRAVVTGNMCRTFGEIWTCVFWDTQANRHTHTDTHTQTQTRSSQYFTQLPRRSKY